MTPKTIAATVATAAYLGLLGFLYAHLSMNPDQAIFSYVGWLWSEGATLYVDVGEQNWPGAMWFHGLAITLFGAHDMAWRTLEWLLLLATVPALGSLLPDRQDRLQRLFLWWIYPTMYAAGGIWFSGQRDITAGHLLVMAGAAFAARLRGGPMVLTVGVALGLFLATMIRPTFLLFGPLLIGVALLVRRDEDVPLGTVLKDSAVTLGVFGGLVGATLALGAATGGLAGFQAQSLDYNLGVYQDSKFHWHFLPEYAQQWVLALPAAAIAGLAWLQSGRDRLGGGVLLSLTVTNAVSYLVMGKGFGYHLGALHPVLGALVTVGVVGAVRLALSPTQVMRRATAGLVVLLAAASLARNMAYDLDKPIEYLAGRITEAEMRATHDFGAQWPADVQYAIADRIRAEVPEGETVLTWSRLPLINFLAKRRLPFEWSNTGMLEMARPPFEHAEAWQSATVAGLDAKPPRMLVTEHTAEGGLYLLQPDAEPTPFLAWVQRALEEDYEEVGRWGNFRLWGLRKAPPPGS